MPMECGASERYGQKTAPLNIKGMRHPSCIPPRHGAEAVCGIIAPAVMSIEQRDESTTSAPPASSTSERFRERCF